MLEKEEKKFLKEEIMENRKNFATELIEKIENGDGIWNSSWNIDLLNNKDISGKEFEGKNRFKLAFEAGKNEFDSNEWLSLNEMVELFKKEKEKGISNDKNPYLLPKDKKIIGTTIDFDKSETFMNVFKDKIREYQRMFNSILHFENSDNVGLKPEYIEKAKKEAKEIIGNQNLGTYIYDTKKMFNLSQLEKLKYKKVSNKKLTVTNKKNIFENILNSNQKQYYYLDSKKDVVLYNSEKKSFAIPREINDIDTAIYSFLYAAIKSKRNKNPESPKEAAKTVLKEEIMNLFIQAELGINLSDKSVLKNNENILNPIKNEIISDPFFLEEIIQSAELEAKMLSKSYIFDKSAKKTAFKNNEIVLKQDKLERYHENLIDDLKEKINSYEEIKEIPVQVVKIDEKEEKTKILNQEEKEQILERKIQENEITEDKNEEEKEEKNESQEITDDYLRKCSTEEFKGVLDDLFRINDETKKRLSIENLTKVLKAKRETIELKETETEIKKVKTIENLFNPEEIQKFEIEYEEKKMPEIYMDMNKWFELNDKFLSKFVNKTIDVDDNIEVFFTQKSYNEIKENGIDKYIVENKEKILKNKEVMQNISYKIEKVIQEIIAENPLFKDIWGKCEDYLCYKFKKYYFNKINDNEFKKAKINLVSLVEKNIKNTFDKGSNSVEKNKANSKSEYSF